MNEYYRQCLNELLRASCPPPFGPAELFKFVPDELVRKNLAALGKQLRYVGLLRCSTTGTPDRRSAARNLHVGDLDQSTLFAIFPLILFTWM